MVGFRLSQDKFSEEKHVDDHDELVDVRRNEEQNSCGEKDSDIPVKCPLEKAALALELRLVKLR
jgi:hypothetical protein